MKLLCAVVLAVVPYTTSSQQSSSPQLPPTSPVSSSEVYELDNDVKPPQLLPAVLPTASGKDCQKHLHGKVVLNMQVDAQGAPVFTYFIKANGNGLDRLALSVAGNDRFTPATRDGIPVPVRQSLEMNLRGCSATTIDAAGQPAKVLHLETQPSQVLGRSVRKIGTETGARALTSPGQIPPTLIRPDYPDLMVPGNLLAPFEISLSVDEHGLPHNPTVVSPAGYRLDGAALDALNNYRFVPALVDGKPVAYQFKLAIGTRIIAPSNIADHR